MRLPTEKRIFSFFLTLVHFKDYMTVMCVSVLQDVCVALFVVSPREPRSVQQSD